MSYILDALKKAEHDKQKKAEAGSMSSIAGDLFQERSRPAANGGRGKQIVPLLVVALIASIGTWVVLQVKKTGKPSVPSVVAVQPLAGSPAVSTAPVQQIPMPTTTVAVEPTVPVVSASVDDERTTADKRRLASTDRNKKIQRTDPVAAIKQPVQMIQPPADIKVSGIAWQDDHQARRAVINGFLVKEGGVVSGAKVAKIMADRVCFVSSVGRFEIKLDNAPAMEGRR